MAVVADGDAVDEIVVDSPLDDDDDEFWHIWLTTTTMTTTKTTRKTRPTMTMRTKTMTARRTMCWSRDCCHSYKRV